MTLNLYSYNGIREKLNKTTTDIARGITCNLLDVTDVTQPTITVEGNVSNILSANYSRLVEFNRTYFIEKKEVDTNDITILHLKSDPLYTFKDDIKNWDGELIELDDNSGNSYMQDQTGGVKGSFANNNYRCSVNGVTDYHGVDGGLDPLGGHDTFHDSSVVLVFAGYNSVSSAIGNFVDPLQTGFFSAYASGDNMAGIRSFAEKFWGLRPDTVIANALLKPIDSCISMHILPFRPTGVGTTSINAGYTTLTLDASVNKLGSSYKKMWLGTIELIPDNYTADFRWYPPFQTYKLYLPFVGMVDINPSDFITVDASGQSVHCRIRIEYDINMLTGDFVCTLHAPEYSLGIQTSVQPKMTHQGNLAVKLPVTGGDAASLASGCLNAANTALSYTTSALSGGEGAVQGNAPGMLFSAGGLQKGTMSGNTLYMGENTDFWYAPRVYITKPARIVGPTPAVNGYPFASSSKTINELIQSYNLQDNAYFRYRKVKPLMSTGMTTEECDEVTQILEGGCYL